MGLKLKIVLLLITFLPIFTDRLLDIVIGDDLEATIYTGWVLAIVDLYSVYNFLLATIPLILWGSIAGIGLYNILRSDSKRDRSLLVFMFTFLSTFFLTIFIPIVFFW